MHGTLIPLAFVVALFGCQSSGVKHSDPKAIWAHPEYKEYERGMKDAITLIQAGKIVIPLDGFLDEVRLHKVLKNRFGIAIVDARNWSSGYSSAYDQAMRQAAANRFGSEWWVDSLQEAGIDLTITD